MRKSKRIPYTNTCPCCGETKADAEFPPDRGRTGGRCILCKRAQHREWYKKHGQDYFLNKTFGIDASEYAKMHSQQNGLCAICHQPETMTDPRTGKVRCLAVDHDHRTGQIRGLLCCACNKGLGIFADAPDRLRAAALYLEKHS